MASALKGPKGNTSKAAVDLTTAHQRAALQKINRLLLEDPQKIFPALAITDRDDLLQLKKNESQWHPTTVHFKGIPKYWMQEYLTFLAPTGEETIALIDTSTSDATRKVFNFIHMLDDTTKIPRNALDKEIFSHMLHKRYNQCGKLLPRVLQHVQPDGEVESLSTDGFVASGEGVPSIKRGKKKAAPLSLGQPTFEMAAITFE